MKKTIITLLLTLVCVAATYAQGMVSVQTVGVLPTNSAEVNREHLQAAIDKMSPVGGVLYVEPVQGGYPMQSGIVLRRNVTLQGAHGPTGRGTALPDRSGPTGSLFVITDREQAFLTVESATQVRGSSSTIQSRHGRTARASWPIRLPFSFRTRITCRV